MPDIWGMIQVERARRWLDAGFFEKMRMSSELMGVPPQWAIDYVKREEDVQQEQMQAQLGS